MGLTTEGGQAEMNNNLGLHVRVQYHTSITVSTRTSTVTVVQYVTTKEREWYSTCILLISDSVQIKLQTVCTRTYIQC